MQEFTLEKPTKGKYKKKGSDFYSTLEPVSSIEHIKSILLTIKNQFPDASHICYAYRIIKGNNVDEFTCDSGEPNVSAGFPLLNVLKRNQIINVVIFVIRYFGGIKLGIPRLIHAYRNAAEDAIENAKIIPCFEKKRLLVTYPYNFERKIKSIIKQNQANIIHKILEKILIFN